MLALGIANLAGVVLFGAVYAAGGARHLSQSGFVAGLVLIFFLVTAVWVWTESRHAALDVVRRLGRAAAGLAMVVVGIPVVVLMPLFWLETMLPPEAGFSRVLAPIMTLTLLSLVLTALANVIGSMVIVARAVVGGRATRR